ncbi:BTB/POZ protein [Neofusicoccum parvum]|nr:BTB/POZ protein [Neofusicoccum parvum]
MSSNEVSPKLKRKLSRFLDNKYADMKIKCRKGKTFMVHRCIVYCQSNFLEVEGARASAAGRDTIEVNQDSSLVKAMLEYMYDAKYTSVDDDNNGVKGHLWFSVKLYIMAFEYEVWDLTNHISETIQQLLKEDWNELKSIFPDVLQHLYLCGPDSGILHTLFENITVNHLGELLSDLGFVDVILRTPYLGPQIFRNWSTVKVSLENQVKDLNNQTKKLVAEKATLSDQVKYLEKQACRLQVYHCNWCKGSVEMVLRQPLSSTTYYPACGARDIGENWQDTTDSSSEDLIDGSE